ncbi:MAG: stage III sporulation protein AE, partial [Clostridiaceae bacterium]|nr:stage III sporulation protein AE [Clostridiaceae bacterium]
KIVFCVAVAVFFLLPVLCLAEEAPSLLNEVLEPQMEGREMEKLQRSLEEAMTSEAKELFPYYSPKQLMEELVKGNAQEGMETLPGKLLNFILDEVKVNFTLLIKLMIIVFLSAIIKNLQGSFKESTVGELAYFACYAAVVTLVALGFQSVLQYAGEVLDTVDRITGFAIPSMLALLISSGNIVSGSALQPILLLAIQGTVKAFRVVFLPLCLLSGILYLANGLSEKIKISGMAGLLKQVVTWGLAGILTLYGSLVTIQGVTGAVLDGAATKTAKVAMNTFIPVAGKYMADATDTIINCALIVKNTAGVATMAVTLATCFVPILKIFVIIMLYRFTAAIIEPVAEERLFECLTDLSDCMKTILGVVGAALFMFLLSMGALLGAGGISGMMQ